MNSIINTGHTPDLITEVRRIIKESQEIRKLASQEIKFSTPILTKNTEPLLYPRTITLLQGQTGTHKSRFAQLICSLLITPQPRLDDPLGLIRSDNIEVAVLYVDTERNISDQFPYAIQRILIDAGYKKEENPKHFKFISLLRHERKHRFELLKEVLAIYRKITDRHLVIILDVITDCIMNFNSPEDALKLNDLMNLYINDYDASFIGVIHENPGTEKARGHAGTELQNKASSVLQIGFEKGSREILRITNKKNRNAKPFESFHVSYNEDNKRLEELADFAEFQEKPEYKKAPINDVSEFLGVKLSKPMNRAELLEILTLKFDCSTKIMDQRLSEIIDNETLILVNNEHHLLQKSKEGKQIMFNLKKVK